MFQLSPVLEKTLIESPSLYLPVHKMRGFRELERGESGRNRSMTRRAVLAAVGALGASSLSGCSQGGNGEDPTTAPGDGERTTTSGGTATPDDATPSDTEAPATTTEYQYTVETETDRIPFTDPIGAEWMPEESDDELFRVTFDDMELGSYRPTSEDWGGYALDLHYNYLSIEERESEGKYMASHYAEGLEGTGSGNGGGQFELEFDEIHDELYLAYQVRFGEGFEWNHDGGKLPGLMGYIGENAIVGGRDSTGENGWSARMMWRPPYTDRGGRLVQYVYHPDKRGTYGDDFAWFQGFGMDNRRRLHDDEWYWIEHRVKMNDPGPEGEEGVDDGLIEGWFNGKYALEKNGLRFRDVPKLGINYFYFSSFFGGGQDPTYAHNREEQIDYDNFIVSTSPITHNRGDGE
ncbi:polysaccharide lyase [Halosimplex pelagicum]|uniref:Polysaccharide lyase 14 domain-containing protein n=1 Tax=Halosimplex pelagicum TaxID=869886 RepID=A0A7D5P9A4_9EURY|nr:hypothetical protein [Halosimplex pelagicum]QLH82024.1 hypothetical protein HZS54_10500 [Halosimplex pelagicum]